ncbi:MAG: hypothetical protein Q8S03_04155 [Brevundimonas sp.]|uniref:hypothetical protein n=1 Tax=Brevundimonas sp. TaxID=1871086 RepID=UPI0027341EB1|nr:hypothetical protein [Brevundimonas sp.]MDP3403861.1 hypothetical protein [Brevundimonas sp.]
MAATFTPKTSDQTRYGLIGLLAIRRARAMREQQKQATTGQKPGTDAKTPKKRGWWR